MEIKNFKAVKVATSEGCIVYLEGELNLSTAHKFRSEIEPLVHDKEQSLALNFRGLEYIDSTGMGIIVSILKTRDQLNADFTVQEIPPKIQRLFDLTGITKFLDVTKNY